jgi:hypothetical protein
MLAPDFDGVTAITLAQPERTTALVRDSMRYYEALKSAACKILKGSHNYSLWCVVDA